MTDREPVRKGRRRTVSDIRKNEKKDGVPTKPQRGKAHVTAGNLKVMLGEDDVSEWDDEELIRGRRRNSRGFFTGKDPAVIPREVYNETLRRSMRKSDAHLRKMQSDALDQLESIVKGADVEDKDRLKAISIILDRTLGRTPEKVEVSMTPAPWEGLVVTAIVDVDLAEEDG